MTTDEGQKLAHLKHRLETEKLSENQKKAINRKIRKYEEILKNKVE